MSAAAIDPPPQSSLIRSSARSLSFYSLVALIQRSMSLLMLPLYTRYLTRADYGVLELLDLIWTLAALLASVQLSGAVFYYYHLATSDAERQRDLVTAGIGTTLIGVLLGTTGLVAAPAISRFVFSSTAYTGLIQITLLGLGFNLPAEFGLATLRLQDRSRSYTMISIARIVANVGLNVWFLVGLSLGVATMPWSSLITTSVLAISLSGWILLTNSVRLFDRLMLAKMIRYGLPLGISTAGEVVLHFGDRLFLSKAISLSDLGLYGLAYKLGMVVAFAALPFFQFWNAQMVAIVQRPAGEAAYARGATYLLSGLVAVVLGLTVFIDPLLHLVAGPNFRAAGRLVPWVALAYLVRAMGSYWSNTFLIINRPGLVAQTTWIGSGSCLAAYAVLIPLLGTWGAIIATHIGFAAMATYALTKSQHLRPFAYEYGRWIKVAIVGVLATLPWIFGHPIGLAGQIAIGIGCMSLFPVLLILTRFVTWDEVEAITALISRPRVKGEQP